MQACSTHDIEMAHAHMLVVSAQNSFRRLAQNKRIPQLPQFRPFANYRDEVCVEFLQCGKHRTLRWKMAWCDRAMGEVCDTAVFRHVATISCSIALEFAVLLVLLVPGGVDLWWE